MERGLLPSADYDSRRPEMEIHKITKMAIKTIYIHTRLPPPNTVNKCYKW
jgi:hypothetical protein